MLDYYRPGLLHVVLLILGLSVLDAMLTLWLLECGAQELNPIMAYFLSFGPYVFFVAKYLLTSISVVIIVLLNYICIFRIQYQLGNLLKYFAGCFAAVVAWELFLIMRFVL